MKYGYARVSTLSQDLNEQISQLIGLGVKKENIFSEKITGTIKSDDRKQFKKLLSKISSGDELVVMKLDRLGRTAIDIQRTILDLKNQGINITIDGVGTIRNDMVGNLTINLLSAFAEFERALIVDRTQGGRRRAIEAGKKMGRKLKLSKEAQEAIRSRYPTTTGQALALEYGVGLRTIQRIAAGS